MGLRSMRKVLAVALGDRYGVGPELVAGLVATAALGSGPRLVIVGDRAVFESGRATVGANGAYPALAALDAGRGLEADWAFLDRPFAADVAPLGRVSREAGRESLETLSFLVDASRAGMIDGIVYAPLCKEAMRLAGHAAGDELDFIVRRLGLPRGFGEINILGRLWTSRVTSHVPLGEVASLITVDRVRAAIDLIAGTLARSGRLRPRIAVAALNPHAGEGGAFGREEIDVIVPAVAAARAAGHDVAGPFPSDTVFPRARAEGFDGIVTMFHDQGQIALKLLGLGQGVTLLAGLPVPIATPGHGTAYDIAGTGRARADGLAAAVALVSRMIERG